ncbi:hypothetical protein, partial [Ligilactobacillus equi]|uniref:hypothetical protein n=1 Tax=Ligilactobacillus equi TaxID=137357 RepID=UPI000558456E
DNYQQLSDKIKQDYANQVNALNTATKNMNDAKSAVASLESEKQKLEQAVANAQKTLGNDHVKQDPNKKTTTSVADAQKTVTEVSHDYQSQTKAINDTVAVGEKVNSANSQLIALIDKYNALAKEVGQKTLDKNTSKSVASLSDSALNKQKADLQKQIDILQAQVDAQKEAEYMESALKNAYDGKFSTTAKNVKLVLKYPNNTLTSTMNNGSVAYSNGLELSFDIGSEGLKKGDTIKVFTAKFSGNDQYWNNQNSFKFPSGSEVYDEDGNKVGDIRLTNERTGDDGYEQGSNTPLTEKDYTNDANSSHNFFIQLTKDISRVGKQHLVVNIKSGYDVLEFIGATPYTSMGLDEIHSTLTFTDPDGHKLADDIHINLTRPTEAHEIVGQHPDYVGSVVRPTWTNFYPSLLGINGTLYASNDDNAPSDKIGKNANEVAKSVHPVENYAFTSHIENKDGSPLFMSSLDDLSKGKYSITSPVGVADLFVQVVDANNNLTGAVIKVNTGNNDTNTNIEAKNVIHAEDNLSEQQLSQRLDKNKFMLIYSIQDDNSYNLAYNLPSDLVKQWIDKFATPELFKKLMVSWDLGYYGDPDKVIENTINYVKNSHYVPVSISGTTGWNFYNNPNKVNTLTSTINQVSVNDNRSPIKSSLEIKSVPSQELQSGQSGIILHYIDGLTGHEMKTNDTSIGDVGSNQRIEPNELFGYELTTEGAKYPSGVKTIETDTTVKYPADGTWADYYVVYMPLDVNAVGGLYDKPTVTYSLNDVTVNPDTIHWHEDTTKKYGDG